MIRAAKKAVDISKTITPQILSRALNTVALRLS